MLLCMGPRLLPALALLALGSASTQGATVRVTAGALERTARAQLFNDPRGRFFLRGGPDTPCYVFADEPTVFFRGDRIVVRVLTHAHLGTTLRGACLGVALNTVAVVSLVPEAEGETIGFRDAHVEQLTDNRELNFLLTPFLSGRLPQQLRVNAADLLRRLLSGSTTTTGYAVSLTRLQLHSLSVQQAALVLDADADLKVD